MHGNVAIQEMLKRTLIQRLNSWIEWDGNSKWLVLTRRYRAKSNDCLLETEDLKEALEKLMVN